MTPSDNPPHAGPSRTALLLRRARWPVAALATGLAILLLGLGAVPVGLFRSTVEQRLSDELDATVRVGAITRDSAFSYAPVVSVRDVRIAQPAWAGAGDFIRIRAASVRIPIFALIFGSFRPGRVTIDGARIALVRDASGRANWQPDGPRRDPPGDHPTLSDLTVSDTQVVLRDAKRGLVVGGPFSVDAAHGLRWSARGRFLDTPATLDLTGGRIAGVDPVAPYPVAVRLWSPALRLSARGVMAGVLNTRHFTAAVTAQAPTLKNIDRIIEAGLFGSQPVDFAATVRHDGHDWFIDRIAGSMGISRFEGRASVVKQGGRTAIDATVHASQFDFDDLADTTGRALSARRRSAIGPRVIPPTRIDLSKLGKTDGRIVFTIDRLLAQSGTVFRTLRGTLALDHRKATMTNLVATLGRGRMTGTIGIDHRSGLPRLSLDLRLENLTLEALIGKPDTIAGQVRGHIVLAGEGVTVRDALAHASGKAAIVATQGSVKRLVADVLGQNLSGAIGHAISGPREQVPLRCLIADFRASRGVLVPHALEIDTGASVGRGSGRISLDGETIDLTLSGASKSRALLRIADPIRVGGTLSSPSVSVAGIGHAEKPNAGTVLKVFGRSLGQALGITRTPPAAGGIPPPTFDCATAVASALR